MDRFLTLTPGVKVRITNNLKRSKTDTSFNLDSLGHMLEMQGNVYSLDSIDHDSGQYKIRHPRTETIFVFDPEDLTLIDGNKKKSESSIFKFNIKHLDI